MKRAKMVKYSLGNGVLYEINIYFVETIHERNVDSIWDQIFFICFYTQYCLLVHFEWFTKIWMSEFKLQARYRGSNSLLCRLSLIYLLTNNVR